MIEAMNICVVGLGKLGACVAAVLADAGHHVIGYDKDPMVVARVARNEENPEPGLNDLFHRTLGRTLDITIDFEYAVGGSDFTFVVVPTPSKEDGSFDSRAVEEVVRQVRKAARPNHLCTVVSTVSPGTMRGLKGEEYTGPEFAYAYNPMLIALGSVIENLRNPDVMIIGADYRSDALLIETIWREAIGDLVAHPELSLEEAEIAKLAINAYVVTKIAFANTIASLCGRTENADAKRVLRAIGTDKRIGNRYFAPGGPGGQGPCFARDELALKRALEKSNAPSFLPDAVRQVEVDQVADVVRFFEPYKKVAVLGTTYKAGTPVTDNSLGNFVAMELSLFGKKVFTYDPMGFRNTSTAEEAIELADAVLIATPWPEFGKIHYEKLVLDMWGITERNPLISVWGHTWPV